MVKSSAGPMTRRERQRAHWQPEHIGLPSTPQLRANSHAPSAIKISGQKRSRPYSAKPMVCSRNRTPSSISTTAPIGILLVSIFAPPPKVAPSP